MTATRTAPRTITIEFSEALDGIDKRAGKALGLDLLHDAQISPGRAAQLPKVTRYDILDLMVSHHIPSGPLTAEEMRQVIEDTWQFTQSAAAAESNVQS